MSTNVGAVGNASRVPARRSHSNWEHLEPFPRLAELESRRGAAHSAKEFVREGMRCPRLEAGPKEDRLALPGAPRLAEPILLAMADPRRIEVLA